MPKMTITHKSWCREHQTDYEGEHCFSGGFEFGPMNPAQGDFPAHRMGDLWAGQQLGEDREPIVALEYRSDCIELRVEDVLPLRLAIDGLLRVLGATRG